MLRSASPLFDRLLAPSTRLMARLRFSHKAMVIGAAFLVSCAVLAGIIEVRASAELADARLQRTGITGLAQLQQTMLAMQRHSQLVVRRAAKEEVAPAAIQAAGAEVAKQLDAFDAWQKESMAGKGLDKPLATVRVAWSKAAAAHDDAMQAIADHDAAIRRVGEAMSHLSEASRLSLATDPGVSYMGRAAAEWVPALGEYAAQQGLIGVRVLGEGAIWVDDRTGLAVARNMEDYVHARIALEQKNAAAAAPAVAAVLAKPLDAALAAVRRQNAALQTHVLDAETPDLPVAKMGAQVEQTRQAVAAALVAANRALDKAAALQIAALERRQAMTLAIVLCVLLLTGYLFLGFTRNTRRSLHEIEDAAGLLARGQFPQAVAVRSRDELRGIADSLESAIRTLRSFEQGQRKLFEAHQAGQIGERLDTDSFEGAFGVMADEINTLVGSHIDMNMRVIEVVSAYAQGDLSQDIERYPGEKARVTEAVDAVKAGMLAVNAEIKALVDAAVAGDFSRRGDAQRFAFVYRELVEALNTLMATADGGLAEVGALLSAIADGDLNRRIETDLPGQFGRLAADANRTVEQLTQIVAQIRIGSDAINAAAGEIAAGNNDLSQRTEQQAASLEETASSMEELTSTVRQNADNARQANQLALGAADVAEQGGAVVGQVVDTMSAISHSSKKIADIIGVIDGIAFQTNILALNAAVEAARAGEQGRGFAVVASEVRSLAQRSANAAKEIKALITDSVGKVEEGSALVDRAGRTMGEIVQSVKRVTDIIADIAAASAEQSAGIEQVNQAITSMDEGTQQNAALVEEASASARALEQQAEQLVDTVAVFRVDAARLAEVERPQAAVVEMPAPRSRRAATPPAPTRAATRARRPQPVMAGTEDNAWQEF
ncbi:MAG TPA: methyl-accepting chemotaxis protein [Xanthomonadaceae bacterium]|nr:methyl-accepting chemotaxis protein [Xanthomonadaceae bacterium]